MFVCFFLRKHTSKEKCLDFWSYFSLGEQFWLLQTWSQPLLFASTGQGEALSPFNVQSAGQSFSPTQLNLTSNYLGTLYSHHSKGSNTCRFILIIKSGYEEPLKWCSPCDEQKGVCYSRSVSLYMCVEVGWDVSIVQEHRQFGLEQILPLTKLSALGQWLRLSQFPHLYNGNSDREQLLPHFHIFNLSWSDNEAIACFTCKEEKVDEKGKEERRRKRWQVILLLFISIRRWCSWGMDRQ